MLHLFFLKNGQQLIAGSYPGSLFLNWDVETGEETSRLQAPVWSSPRFLAKSDRLAILGCRDLVRKRTRFERNGEVLYRWENDSEAQLYDAESGKLLETFRHSTPRGILAAYLSPDGSTLVTSEELSGETSGAPERAATLWDVKKTRALPENLQPTGVFSPDGKLLVVYEFDRDWNAVSLKLLDLATFKEELVIPYPENCSLGGVGFADGGKTLFATVHDAKHNRYSVKFWDVRTGEMLAGGIDGKEKEYFYPILSPDGRWLLVVESFGSKGKLHFIDAATRKLAHTIEFSERAQMGKAQMGKLAFSPDGKWIAVSSQVLPEEMYDLACRDEFGPEHLPQPRIHLIEFSTRTVRETIVAPPGHVAALCFSPDGKTLVSGGQGRVLLWDICHPPLGQRK